MRSTKIKTSGLNLILKSLGYKTNVVVNNIHHGNKTILVAMGNDIIIEMHLTLRESTFFGDSKVYLRIYDMKKDRELLHENIVNSSNRKTIAKSISQAFESAHRETNIFSKRLLKMIYLSLIDTKTIKELYSLRRQITKVTELIDNVKL